MIALVELHVLERDILPFKVNNLIALNNGDRLTRTVIFRSACLERNRETPIAKHDLLRPLVDQSIQILLRERSILRQIQEIRIRCIVPQLTQPPRPLREFRNIHRIMVGCLHAENVAEHGLKIRVILIQIVQLRRLLCISVAFQPPLQLALLIQAKHRLKVEMLPQLRNLPLDLVSVLHRQTEIQNSCNDDPPYCLI